GVASDASEHIANATTSSGSPLPDDLRSRFEGSLGVELSGVRVHTGAESQSAAHSVGAKAYTTGQDIHFGEGHYEPTRWGGQHLVAHEVAHTVQQRGASTGGGAQFKLEVSTPGDSYEHEADRAADAMVAGQAATVTSVSSATIARDINIA